MIPEPAEKQYKMKSLFFPTNLWQTDELSAKHKRNYMQFNLAPGSSCWVSE